MKKTLTRYAGKVLAVIKHDGFVGGTKNIFLAAYEMLRPVGMGDILFVSSGVVGHSARYRVKNVMEELRLHGFKCSFAIQEHPALPSFAKKFKIFIFHQVSDTVQVKLLLENIKKQQGEIIFETDDLLFNKEQIKEQDFFKNSNALMKKFYENGVGLQFVNDPYVKTCSTTTDYLAKKLREHGKQVFVAPNRLSKKDLEIAVNVLKIRHELRSAVRIGYFSGSMSHNKDFATVEDALFGIMEKHPLTELYLAGPLEITNTLNKFRDRVKILPHVSREKHFENVSNVDINIAPLEIGNPFCESRSELKFFEAGIVRVPTVASATEPFRLAIKDGEDGFVAKDTKEWTQKLERLITDDKLRERMGDNAREKALAKYSTENSDNEEYYAYLRSKLKKHN